MNLKFVFIFSFLSCVALAQFPGPVGSIGTSAMYKDSSAFIAWGKTASVTLGYQDISNTSLGFVSTGTGTDAIAKADGSVVSLGDGGSAVISFSNPITNGPGYDFAVFENAFNDSFLELAFVEVSSDGINYFRFPPTSNSQYTVQYGNSAAVDATKLDNLAGKYRALYGTPFDLQQLVGIPLFNTNAVTHVKIIDVVGAINAPYATYDKNNNPVNDPWPTAFASSGFDLDAVGVINEAGVGIEEYEKNNFVLVYPNPVSSEFSVRSPVVGVGNLIKVFDTIGEELLNEVLEHNNQSFDISHLHSGVYLVCIETKKGKIITKLIKE